MWLSFYFCEDNVLFTFSQQAQMSLYKPSEQAHSDPVEFFFHPKAEDFKYAIPEIPPLVNPQAGANRQATKRTRTKNATSSEDSSSKLLHTVEFHCFLAHTIQRESRRVTQLEPKDLDR